MAFYTSLFYYRPRQPPVVTSDDLARFIEQLHATGVLTGKGLRSLSVKFGDGIDQDEQGTVVEEETAPGLATVSDIEWDLELFDSPGASDMMAALRGDVRRIYRAQVSLGGAVDAVLRPITRTNSPENKVDFCPDSVSLEIGPIQSSDLDSDIVALVGWIGVSLHGYGYLFPWTFREVLHRLESTPEIQRLAEACRTLWPVPPQPLDPRIESVRRQLGRLWPYEKLDEPWNWYWGLRES